MTGEGFADYFNSTTIRGRANVAKATFAGVGAIVLYFKAFGGKKVRCSGITYGPNVVDKGSTASLVSFPSMSLFSFCPACHCTNVLVDSSVSTCSSDTPLAVSGPLSWGFLLLAALLRLLSVTISNWTEIL